MTNEREQLSDQYLEAQLREELGIEPDLSEGVLSRYYAKHPPEKRRRVIPPLPRKAVWRPIAAAAVVLLAAGLTTYGLVTVLPNQLQPGHREEVQAERNVPAKQETKETKGTPEKPDAEKDLSVDPESEAAPERKVIPDEAEWENGAPEVPEKPDTETTPDDKPEPKEPDDVVGPDPNGMGRTDPPEAFPDPAKEDPYAPDKTAARPGRVLVSMWSGDSLKVTRADGGESKVKEGEDFSIRAGDRITPRGVAEFMLLDGGLLRLDGEITFEGEPEALKLTLHDGALYADVAHEISVASEQVTARLAGVGVLEQRLHGFDVFCISGTVRSTNDGLEAGYRARLEDDGFKHEKAIGWDDVQREFKFLRETPRRSMLREELTEAPGELFGGAIEGGVLKGESDPASGLGFYLRQPYAFQDGDVVRFRFKVDKACELILQFGSEDSGNWRHKLGGIKPGEWIEYELPLVDLYKTTDVAVGAQPGLSFKFFQLHPEETTTGMEIDWVEIVHTPE
ncbi:MAG: hypothetical protein KDB68_07915 [Planctomycetes bacterium]|nr:hypothetical protein [Planctomycetota bacterium]